MSDLLTSRFSILNLKGSEKPILEYVMPFCFSKNGSEKIPHIRRTSTLKKTIIKYFRKLRITFLFGNQVINFSLFIDI